MNTNPIQSRQLIYLGDIDRYLSPKDQIGNTLKQDPFWKIHQYDSTNADFTSRGPTIFLASPFNIHKHPYFWSEVKLEDRVVIYDGSNYEIRVPDEKADCIVGTWEQGYEAEAVFQGLLNFMSIEPLKQKATETAMNAWLSGDQGFIRRSEHNPRYPFEEAKHGWFFRQIQTTLCDAESFKARFQQFIRTPNAEGQSVTTIQERK